MAEEILGSGHSGSLVISQILVCVEEGVQADGDEEGCKDIENEMGGCKRGKSGTQTDVADWLRAPRASLHKAGDPHTSSDLNIEATTT